MSEKEQERTGRKIRVVVPPTKKCDKDSYTVAELYDEYYKVLQRRFTRITECHEDGEDLTQEVFERLIKYWPRVQKNKIEAALAVICHNTLYDFRGKQFNRPHTIHVDDILEYDCHDNGINDPFRSLLSERVFDQVDEAMDLLTDQQRRIFSLYHVHSETTREIAHLEGCSETTVYSALNAARKLLTQLYEKPELEIETHG